MKYLLLSIMSLFACSQKKSEEITKPEVFDASPLVAKYCSGCHSDTKKLGGISLSSNDKVKSNAAKVILEINSRDMPPERVKAKPTDDEMELMVKWVKSL